jgi:hypothetical protein
MSPISIPICLQTRQSTETAMIYVITHIYEAVETRKLHLSQGSSSHPPLHCISGVRVWGVESAIAHRTLRLASVGGVIRGWKGQLQYKRCKRFGRKVTMDSRPCALRVVAPTYPVDALPLKNSLSAAAAWETTRRNTKVVLRGKKRRRLLQRRRPSVAEIVAPQATLTLWKLRGPGPLPSRWTWAKGWNRHPRRVLSGNHQCTPKPNPTHQLVTEVPA